MGVFSWFTKSSPPDYETLLSRLSAEIEESKVHLTEIRLRERRWSLLVNAYGVGIWAVWVGLWYFRALPLSLVGLDRDGVESKAIGLGGIAAGPFLIWLLNRILHFVFTRQRDSSDARLRDLLTKQRKHLEDIKKATNYDSTRKLIERYDDSAPPSPHQQFGGQDSPMVSRQMVSQPGTPTPGSSKKGKGVPVTPNNRNGNSIGNNVAKGTPRAPGHLTGVAGTPMRPSGGPGGDPGTPIPIPEGMNPEQAAALHLQMQAIQPVLPTPEKKWYDRVVDSILGEDPAQGSQNKYALVCEGCFRHNGLVGSKYEWERLQWICPRCNHMNPPPISRLSHQPDPSSRKDSTAPLSSSTSTSTSSNPASTIPGLPASSLPSPSPHFTRSSAAGGSAGGRRRLPAERGMGTPRSSKLAQEVFSASTNDADDDDDEDGNTDENDDNHGNDSTGRKDQRGSSEVRGEDDKDRMEIDGDS